MSWLQSLFSSGAGKTVDAVGGAVDKIFTNDEERASALLMLERLRQQPAILQAELNKIEAQSRNFLIAGWRPFIGWVCGFSLAAFFIPKFAIGTYVWVKVISESGWLVIPDYPVSAEGLLSLSFSMLGLGTIRTVEKALGLAK
jgi:hypothetical protein